MVPLLDTNGDQALSREELAIFELLFAGNSYQTAGQAEAPPVEQAPEVPLEAYSEPAAAKQATTANQTAYSGPTVA
ncbi:MAG: hypothetical protein C0407_11035 [Desulfobacca sp.]|nr:hypothetical protein [Desulfobacca sp.]